MLGILKACHGVWGLGVLILIFYLLILNQMLYFNTKIKN